MFVVYGLGVGVDLADKLVISPIKCTIGASLGGYGMIALFIGHGLLCFLLIFK